MDCPANFGYGKTYSEYDTDIYQHKVAFSRPCAVLLLSWWRRYFERMQANEYPVGAACMVINLS